MKLDVNNPNHIFVFGSNLAGRHGMGSARRAFQTFGANYGVGQGMCGRSYAIPTKNHSLHTLPLEAIRNYITLFLHYALRHPEFEFFVVNVGCGLAGYKPKEIAPYFRGAPKNVHLTTVFNQLLGRQNHA